ncbi:MAG: hypothetical protein WCT24_02180 [Patescibacteria group bacterium]
MSRTVTFFRKFADFLNQHRYVAVFCVAILSFSIVHAAFAQDDTLGVTAINTLLTALALIYNVIAWALGKLITLTIGLIIIPILGYNDFGTSNIISIGWPLVRDVVNMFIIILLLIIAIKTMFGLKGQGIKEAQDQILKIFFAVIAVNFSRLICLLFIDFGQVIMFTFVNAIKDIAAGNFVNMFQLNELMSLDATAIMSGGESGVSAFGYLGSAYAAVALLGMVLATLVILAMVFIYRIVLLWVLVIISPLAFFLWGAKDVVSQAGGQSQQWWSKFTGSIMLGPIMTFFLWLGLAAASNGSIAASENFDEPAATDTGGTLSVGLYSEAFQVEKILSLLIGIVIIGVGFQAASGSASGMGGVASKFINEGMGNRLMKGAIAAPYTYGKKVAVGTAKGAWRVGSGAVGIAGGLTGGVLGAGAAGAKMAGAGAKTAGAELARQIERRTGYGGAAAGQWLARKGGAMARAGGLGAPIGGYIAGVGGAMAARSAADEKVARDKAKKEFEGKTSLEQVQDLRSIINPKDNLLLRNQDRSDEAIRRLMTDPKAAGKLKEELKAVHGGNEDAANAEFDTIYSTAMQRLEDKTVRDALIGDDKEGAKALMRAQAGRPDLLESSIREQQKKALGVKGEPTAEQQNTINEKTTEELKKRLGDMVANPDFDTRWLSKKSLDSAAMREALENQQTGRVDKEGNGVTLMQDVMRGVRVTPEVQKAMREDTVAPRKTKQGDLISYDTQGAKADDIDRNIRGGHIQVDTLTVGNLQNPEVFKGVMLAGQKGADLSALVSKPDVLAAFDQLVEAEENKYAGDTSSEAQKKLRNLAKTRFAVEQNPSALSVDVNSGEVSDEKLRPAVAEILAAKPEIVLKFASNTLQTATDAQPLQPSHVTQAITESIKPETIRNWVEQYLQSNDNRVRADLKSKISVARNASRAEYFNRPPGADAVKAKATKEKLSAVKREAELAFVKVDRAPAPAPAAPTTP